MSEDDLQAYYRTLVFTAEAPCRKATRIGCRGRAYVAGREGRLDM